MSNKLFVGNLSFNTTENDLQDAFAAFGTVTEANLMMDRMTNRPRGFGFVTMSTPEEAQKAIDALNGKELDGRALTVNIARPREERPAAAVAVVVVNTAAAAVVAAADIAAAGNFAAAVRLNRTRQLFSGRGSASAGLRRLCMGLRMKEEHIEVEGRVTTVLPGTMFRVELDNKHLVLATICGKMRKRWVRLTVGDRVKMEMSPYDLNKARITWRLR